MIKTFLKTTAAVATLVVGSNVWGATLNSGYTILTDTSGNVTAAVLSGGLTTASPTDVISTAGTCKIHTRLITEEAAAINFTLGTRAAANQPVSAVVELLGSVSGSTTVGVTMTTLAPGDVYKIYDGLIVSGARTLTPGTFAFGTNWKEETKIANGGKVAKVEWYGPYEPAYTEVAGITLVYKRVSRDDVLKRFQ